MKQFDKKYYIIGGLVLVVIAVGVWFFTRTTPQTAKNVENESVFEEPNETIQILEDSVEITIKGKTDAEISVKNIPANTKSISYELSYNTKSGSVEGVFGMIDVDNANATEQITFGTCSSGVCKYHQIDGTVKGIFIFEGSYGQKMREQEFAL